MIGYILIVVSSACGGSACGYEWPSVAMQRFEDAKACQFASLKLAELAKSHVRFVCVPEKSK